MSLLAIRYSLLVLLFSLAGRALALDREAFSIPRYDLNVTLDRDKHLLGAAGTITLRNDSKTPQRNIVLQISSQLEWQTITIGGKPVQWLGQPYTSDIDHTGSLSEAVVTLSSAVPPTGTVDIEISYAGEITRDASRLTRIGTPEKIALTNDWDDISTDMTTVRGVGFVEWYPVAIEAANLGECTSLPDAIARWQERQHDSVLNVQFNIASGQGLKLLTNGENSTPEQPTFAGAAVPTFAIAPFEHLRRPTLVIDHVAAHTNAARDWVIASEQIAPILAEWFGTPKQTPRAIELTATDASAWDSGTILFTPIQALPQNVIPVNLAPVFTHASIQSPRRWITDGLGQFAQAVLLSQPGRNVALEYLKRLGETVAAAESPPTPDPKAKQPAPPRTPQPIIASNDPVFYRTKGALIWWMLRDMVGDDALQKAIKSYHPEQDKQPAYMQRLIETQAHRDLEWFFDDWVYRDPGLPDFHIASANIRTTLNGTYVVAVTVENAGQASAEVPVIVRSEQGERSARVLVPHGHSATVRIEIAAVPTEAMVNDGSVPESNFANNTFRIPPPTNQL